MADLRTANMISWHSVLSLALIYTIIVFASVLVEPAKIAAVVIVLALVAGVGIIRHGFLYLLLAAFAFEWLIRFGSGYDAVSYAIEFSMAGVAAAGLFFRGERFALPPSKVLTSFLILFGWIIFRTLFAMNLNHALRGFVFLLMPLLIFMLSYQLLRARDIFRNILIFQLVLAIAFVLAGVSEHIIGGLSRLWLVNMKPNAVAGYTYIAASISLFSIDYFRNKSLKLLSLLALIGLAYVIVLTGSRSAMFALATFCTVYLWFSGRKKLVVVGYSAVFAGIALILLSGIFSDTITQVSRILRLASGLTMRDELWRSAMNLISDYPLAGVGTSCVGTVFSDYVRWTDPRVILLAHGPAEAGIIHNGILNMTAQFGLIGAALTLWTLAASFSYIFRIRRQLTGEMHRLSSFVIAAIVAIMAHGLFENRIPFGVFVNDSMFAIFVAGAFSQMISKTSDRVRHDPGPPDIPPGPE
ncbi:MAG: O-antigen ligase family protein [candidate division Zixibacteria bacterium]|nr:O-antigen ligase family protein [candidate division Zixibacteria bacterium]MBU1469420.1 O-antigen ligase family protein [candidate division Zixibacteria bacterium]MBU2624174.1 O-antigen ligase family protein [candidate division Zixibacteria bacterium]